MSNDIHSYEQFLAEASGLSMQLSGFGAPITQPDQALDMTWPEERFLQGGIVEVKAFGVDDTFDVLAGYLNPPAPHPSHNPGVAIGAFVQVGPALGVALRVPPDGVVDTIVQAVKSLPPQTVIRVLYHTSNPPPVPSPIVGGYWRTWLVAK
jgi:hypothetical protein